MLRLDKLFSIRDIYPQIPREYMKIPSRLLSNPDETKYLEADSCNLCILGQEKGDVLLVAYNGFWKDENVTYICEYDAKLNMLKQLYRHNRVMNCIGCSVPDDRTLLGFTTVTRQPRSSLLDDQPKTEADETTIVDVYESFIVELRDGGKRFSLNTRTEHTQLLKFVSSRPGSSSYAMIYLYEVPQKRGGGDKNEKKKQTADMYLIYTHKLSNNTAEITAHPHLKYRICEKVFWSHWDSKRELLYILEPKKAEKEVSATSSGRRNTCLLTCYHFQDKKPNALVKYATDIQLDFSQESAIARDILSVVRIGPEPEQQASVLCLCQQHPHQPGSRVLSISVFILHHDLRLDFDVPFPVDTPLHVIEKARVFFDAVGNLLLVYIPGYHVQLIDCGVDHDPQLGLTVQGPQLATPLASQLEADDGAVPWTDRFEIRGRAIASSGGLRGQSLLDRSDGSLYEYKFNQSLIISQILDMNDPELHQQALSLALLHLQDTELIGQIVLTLCKNNPLMVTTELLKEYLVSMPYVEFIKTLRQRSVDNSVVHKICHVMPISAMEGIAGDGIRVVRNMEKPKRLRMSMTSMDWSASVDDAIPSQSVFKKLVSNVNRWFGLPDHQPVVQVEEEDWFDPNKMQIVGSITKHLNDAFAKESKVTKGDCFNWAMAFRAEQGRQASKLYQYILKSMQDKPKYITFQVLSSLHCAMEELMVPYPKAFYEEFTALGYRCQPRHVFIQWIERGVFVITPEFAASAIENLRNTPEDQHFKYYLMSVLPEIDALEILRKCGTDDNYIVEHMLSYEQDKNANIDMENVLEADFLPAAVYLEALESKKLLSAEDFNYLASVTKRAFRKTLRLTDDLL